MTLSSPSFFMFFCRFDITQINQTVSCEKLFRFFGKVMVCGTRFLHSPLFIKHIVLGERQQQRNHQIALRLPLCFKVVWGYTEIFPLAGFIYTNAKMRSVPSKDTNIYHICFPKHKISNTQVKETSLIPHARVLRGFYWRIIHFSRVYNYNKTPELPLFKQRERNLNVK